jgi:hypothetical protein
MFGPRNTNEAKNPVVSLVAGSTTGYRLPFLQDVAPKVACVVFCRQAENPAPV